MDRRDPARILDRLVSGNRRFCSGETREGAGWTADLAADQEPLAVVLGCSDSRVAPEIVFDASLGELFVVRVAGNVANRSSIASIEFAVAALGVRLVIVLAHERCGAVTAAMEGGEHGENLRGLLDHVIPAVAAADRGDVDTVARRNARRSAERLVRDSAILRRAVEDDGLRIVTGFFHLSTGRVEFDAP